MTHSELSTQNSALSTCENNLPNYWETVTIGWRILWQGIGGFVIALVLANLLVIGFLPELTRTGPSPWALAVPLLGASALTLFVLLPLVVRGLVSKPFGAFRLTVIHDEPAPFHSPNRRQPYEGRKGVTS